MPALMFEDIVRLGITIVALRKRRWTNDKPKDDFVRQKYFSPWDSFTWEWDINEPHEGEK